MNDLPELTEAEANKISEVGKQTHFRCMSFISISVVRGSDGLLIDYTEHVSRRDRKAQIFFIAD